MEKPEIVEIEEIVRKVIVHQLQRGPLDLGAIVRVVETEHRASIKRAHEALVGAQLRVITRTVMSRIKREKPDADGQMSIPGLEHVPVYVRLGRAVKPILTADLEEVEKLAYRYSLAARSLKKSSAKKAQEAELAAQQFKQLAAQMRFLNRESKTSLTVEEAILRTSEYEAERDRRVRVAKKAAKTRARRRDED